MPHAIPTKKVSSDPEQHASKEAAKKPGPEDVHEQRQVDQQHEGVVKETGSPREGSRPPTQSLVDQERGDWEGMGQSRHQPD